MNTQPETTQTAEIAKVVAPAHPAIGKAKEIGDLDQRRIFSDIDSALSYVEGTQTLQGANGIEYIIYGTDADGNIDPSAYQVPGVETYAVLRMERVKTKDGAENQVKELVIWPVPTLDALLADEQGREMVQEVIRKELNHRLVRPLRTREARKDSYPTTIQSMPVTIADYCAASRASSGLIEAFEAHYKSIVAALVKLNEAFKRARITKPDLKQALENAAFASYHYGRIEDAGIFQKILEALIVKAKKDGMDSSLLETWLATRHEQTYEVEETAEDSQGEITLDALLA